jgi:hypothetical protein
VIYVALLADLSSIISIQVLKIDIKVCIVDFEVFLSDIKGV